MPRHSLETKGNNMTEVITWEGWMGGLAVGLYAVTQYWLTGHPLGVSTGYGNVCALGSSLPYFRTGPYANPINWRLWFVLGLPLGGVIAAVTSPGVYTASFSLGALYDGVFPQALGLKALLLVAGGFAMGFGARAAGGCTSGHAISGVAFLNPPSMLAAAGFFVGGTVMVQVLFRVWG